MPVHDADGAVAELAATQHGAFTRRQAAERGMTAKMIRARLAAGTLREAYDGVFVCTSAANTWRQDVAAATLVRPGIVAASARCAGALHGLDGCPSDIVELHCPRAQRARVPGAVVHRVASLEPRDLIRVDGILTTSIARTLADLGSVVSADRVEQALDDARRRGVSLRWLTETAMRLHRPGQKGTSTLLGLLEAIDPDDRVRDSWFEALVERCLVSPNLPPLERQYTVRCPKGRFAGRVDTAFPDITLAIEAHSRQFHFGRRAEQRDEDRDLRLAALGWHVLYVGWQHTKAADQLLRVVEATAATRKWVTRTPARARS